MTELSFAPGTGDVTLKFESIGRALEEEKTA